MNQQGIWECEGSRTQVWQPELDIPEVKVTDKT